MPNWAYWTSKNTTQVDYSLVVIYIEKKVLLVGYDVTTQLTSCTPWVLCTWTTSSKLLVLIKLVYCKNNFGEMCKLGYQGRSKPTFFPQLQAGQIARILQTSEQHIYYNPSESTHCKCTCNRHPFTKHLIRSQLPESLLTLSYTKYTHQFQGPPINSTPTYQDTHLSRTKTAGKNFNRSWELILLLLR